MTSLCPPHHRKKYLPPSCLPSVNGKSNHLFRPLGRGKGGEGLKGYRDSGTNILSLKGLPHEKHRDFVDHEDLRLWNGCKWFTFFLIQRNNRHLFPIGWRICKCFFTTYVLLPMRVPFQQYSTQGKQNGASPVNLQTRWLDISYPPVFSINRMEFSYFCIKSKEPKTNSKTSSGS